MSSVARNPEALAPGRVYISLEAGEDLVIASLLRYQAELSRQNDAPGRARQAESLANRIDDIAQRIPPTAEEMNAVCHFNAQIGRDLAL